FYAKGSSSRPLNLSFDDWGARSGQVIPSLDGIRAVSLLIVLLGHVVLPASMIGITALGLDIFFFVSGFLITRLFYSESKETGGVNLLTFYLRRVLRLYPVLAVYLVVALIVQTFRNVPVNKLEVYSV